MEQDHESQKSGIAGRLIPIALTVVIFVIIFWRIPFGEFVLAISKARLAPFLALMGCFSICFFLMDTFVLSRMIRWFHGPLTFPTLLPVRAVTYVVSIINTQLAQVALALYFHRRFHTPLAEITSTVAMLILLEVTNLISFATVGLIAFRAARPSFCSPCPLGSPVFGCSSPRWRGGTGRRRRENRRPHPAQHLPGRPFQQGRHRPGAQGLRPSCSPCSSTNTP